MTLVIKDLLGSILYKDRRGATLAESDIVALTTAKTQGILKQSGKRGKHETTELVYLSSLFSLFVLSPPVPLPSSLPNLHLPYAAPVEPSRGSQCWPGQPPSPPSPDSPPQGNSPAGSSPTAQYTYV